MDQVDALYVDRYWSQVLCCSIMTHLSDLEFKVTAQTLKIYVKAFAFNCIFLEQMDGFD